VDGHECGALRGAAGVLQRFRPTIVMELAPYALDEAGSSLEELIEILERHGYRLEHEATGRAVTMDPAELRRRIPVGCTINVIARAIILSDSQDIQAEHLRLPVVVQATDVARHVEDVTLSYRHSMEAHSRWLIREALRRTDGNQTKAAAMLKLQRTYFTRLLKQRGIAAKRSEP
jgi:DNA-binding protein Fis